MRIGNPNTLTEITDKLNLLNPEELAVLLSTINQINQSKSNDSKISSIDGIDDLDDGIIDPEDLDISYDEEDEFEDDITNKQEAKSSELVEEIPRKSEDSEKSSSGSSTDIHLPNLFEEAKVSKSYKSRQSIGSGLTHLPDDRGRTRIGIQGEHAIAYVVFETILKRAIAGQKISRAPQIIRDTFSSFLIDDTSMQNMGEVFELYSNEADKFRNTKNYFKDEEIAIPEEHLNTTKEALKIASRLKYAKMIEVALDTCIFGSNKMNNLTYPDDGVPSNPNTGQERGAKDDLMILNEFFERLYENLNQEKTENESIINQTRFLKKLEDRWNINQENIAEIIESARQNIRAAKDDGKSPAIKSILRQELKTKLDIENISNRIIDKMGKLFYYPRINGVKKAYEIDGVTENWAVSKKTWESKSQKYNKGTLPRSNNLEEMYKTVALAQVSFAHMTPSFALLGQLSYTRIMDGFLQHAVLDDRNVEGKMIQGWERVIIEKTNARNALQYLRSKINSTYANINYASPKEFSLFGSTKFDNIKNINTDNLKVIER